MMELDMIRENLCTELKRYNTLKSINKMELDEIHKLTDTIKNIDKIKMLNETTSGYITESDIGRMTEEDKMVVRKAMEILSK